MEAAWTCKDGRMVHLLIDAGAAVNDRSKTGDTALMMAASNGDEEAVKALVSAGADLSAKNAEGETALTFAQSYGIGKKQVHKRIYAYLRRVSKQVPK
jgi:ankyrin repeat protein